MPEDIRIALNFKTNRKRKRLYKKLGAEGILSLIDLWISVAENRSSGVLTGYDRDDIEIEANWNGESGLFFKEMINCKFLDEKDGVYEMHNWSIRQSWVFTSEDRSDKARFSRMAKTHKALYDKLKEQGVNAISKTDYIKLTNIQRNVNDSLTNSQQGVEEVVTPAPAPAPSPAPDPAPSPDPSPSPTPVVIKKSMSGKDQKKEELKKQNTQTAKDVINILNKKTGKRFQQTDKNLGFIIARLNENKKLTIEDFEKVIAIKMKDNHFTKDNGKYLRPETLFGNKFDGYLNECIGSIQQEQKGMKTHGFNDDYYKDDVKNSSTGDFESLLETRKI